MGGSSQPNSVTYNATFPDFVMKYFCQVIKDSSALKFGTILNKQLSDLARNQYDKVRIMMKIHEDLFVTLLLVVSCWFSPVCEWWAM